MALHHAEGCKTGNRDCTRASQETRHPYSDRGRKLRRDRKLRLRLREMDRILSAWRPHGIQCAAWMVATCCGSKPDETCGERVKFLNSKQEIEMATKSKRTAKVKMEPYKVEPCFQVGIIITCRSLVVDKFGIAWWVDPDSGTVSRAD